jgi:hypothetical protein
MKKKYCILNKQYSQQEYESLLPKIIDHMRKAEEWGQFFPTELSAFGYNETVAQDYFPMTKEQAQSRGYKWKDPDPKDYKLQTYEIPDNIHDTPDDIQNQILACIDCERNYKITSAELRFYRRQSIPIPRKCFHCRHADRMKLRNPRHLYTRNCQKCSTQIQTTYSPDHPEIVYCEKCYLHTVA